MRVKTIVFIVLLSLSIYLWSIYYKLSISEKLGVDFDEPVYLKAGSDIGVCIYRGNLTCLLNYKYNYEHPMLAKIIYGLFISNVEDFKDKLVIGRLVNIVFSSTTIFLLGVISPLAAILHAGDALYVKYTTEVYLDGFTTLFTLASYVLYDKLRDKGVKAFVLSGIFGGFAIGTKYTAIPALTGLFLYILLKSIFDINRYHDKTVLVVNLKKKVLLGLLIWIVIAFSTFIIVNPIFWSDFGKPFEKTMLYSSITFHNQYSAEVSLKHRFPFYQQLVWLWETLLLNGILGSYYSLHPQLC